MTTFMKAIYKVMAIGAVALTGCDYFLPGNQELTTQKDYSSDYEGDRLIMTGYITDRLGVFADVRHSVRPETPHASDSVADAEVTLLRDGEPYAKLRRKEGQGYGPHVCSVFAYHLEPGEVEIARGHSYSLRAESATYGTAESEPDALPEAVRLDSVWTSTYYDGMIYEFEAAFAPAHAGQTVYPMAVQYRGGKAIFYKFFNYDYRIRCISAKATSTSVRRLWMPEAMDSASVEIVTLSDMTADYLQSLADYDESRDDDAYEYPLDVHENVRGGYGFVGALASSALTIVADSVNSVPGRYDDEDPYDRYFFTY